MRRLAVLALLPLTGCVAISAEVRSDSSRDIARTYANATAMYSRTLVIPPGYELIRLPGVIADPVTPAADGRLANFGDTETQASSVFSKIDAALAEVGASDRDVVAMTVYLVAPQPGGAMDFDGMNRAYFRHFGSPDQPNRPVRSTVQVAGLVAPGVLVEIEVTAARKPLHKPD